MDLFTLVAKIGLDSKEYEQGIKGAKQGFEKLDTWMIAKAHLIADGVKRAFSTIADFAKDAVTAAADVAAEKAQFAATFEGIEEAANGVLASVSNETGILATRLQQVGTKAFSQFKGAGIDAAGALSMMGEYTRIAADAAAYYDISLEDADVRLRSFLRGNTEAGDAIGLFTSESQRNSKAVELYGTKWTKLTEAQKQNLMLNVAQEIYDQSGATGQAAREMDGWVNVVGNLQRVWKDVLAVVGAPFYESLTPVVQKLSEFLSDETIQMRLGMLASSLGDMAGYVFDGVIDLLDEILAWSSGEEKPNDTAQALFDIASSFGNIAGMIFTGVVDFLTLLFNGFDKETAENVEGFLEDFSAFVDDPLFQTAATVLGSIVTAWIAMKSPLLLISGVLALIITHWEDIKRWADKAKTAFTNFINTHVPDGFMSGVTAALETVAGLVSGIQSAWSAFVNSLNSTNAEKSIKSIQDGWESGGVAGAASAAWDSAWINPSNWGKGKNYGAGRSFATGLDYVPYDNFVANLHAGETVLNRADATAYRAGNVGGISAESISQAVAVAVREALDGVGVYMGADRVGDLVTQRVSRNIAKGARSMRYANV
uniref:Uncharacterized protein n=1 Tax=Siphoviridae sp. ct8LX107 TaxID=2826169 RepID=A0A8S5QQI7_9CAUD|nr:MAG TPA: hypothetical protein [Siphoviridae sp. ct8LX107]